MRKIKDYYKLKYDCKTLKIKSLTKEPDYYEYWTFTSTPNEYYATIVRTTRERCLKSYNSELSKQYKEYYKKLEQITKLKVILLEKYNYGFMREVVDENN